MSEQSRAEWGVRYDTDGDVALCASEDDARSMAARITSEPVSVVRRIVTVGRWKSEPDGSEAETEWSSNPCAEIDATTGINYDDPSRPAHLRERLR